jgi:predicted RNA binding protein YcfA (HicA-like mRNA interferase family)
MPMKYREVLDLLKRDGWIEDRRKGSHRQFNRPQKPGTVTVACEGNRDVPPGTLNAILKQAGLK